jgi:hypothetical protein
MAFRGVMKDLSDLRDRGPGFKTGSRQRFNLAYQSLISEPYTLWGSHSLSNSVEFRHAKDVKTINRLPNFFLYFFLKVHLKISLNTKFQNLRVTR